MDNRFFEKPILNSPYEYPARHWELDDQGQPTQQIIERRRRAEFSDVYQVEVDLAAKVKTESDKMIEHTLTKRG